MNIEISNARKVERNLPESIDRTIEGVLKKTTVEILPYKRSFRYLSEKKYQSVLNSKIFQQAEDQQRLQVQTTTCEKCGHFCKKGQSLCDRCQHVNAFNDYIELFRTFTREGQIEKAFQLHKDYQNLPYNKWFTKYRLPTADETMRAYKKQLIVNQLIKQLDSEYFSPTSSMYFNTMSFNTFTTTL